MFLKEVSNYIYNSTFGSYQFDNERSYVTDCLSKNNDHFANYTKGYSSFLESDILRSNSPYANLYEDMKIFMSSKLEYLLDNITDKTREFCDSVRYKYFPKVISTYSFEYGCNRSTNPKFDSNKTISTFYQSVSECFKSGADPILMLTEVVKEKCFDNFNTQIECFSESFENIINSTNIMNITNFDYVENCVQTAANSFYSGCTNVMVGDNRNYYDDSIAHALAAVSELCAPVFDELNSKCLVIPQTNLDATSKTILPEDGYQLGIGEGVLIAVAVGVIGVKYRDLIYSDAKNALVACVRYFSYEKTERQEIEAETPDAEQV